MNIYGKKRFILDIIKNMEKIKKFKVNNKSFVGLLTNKQVKKFKDLLKNARHRNQTIKSCP